MYADLHRHLDGSLRASTWLELAKAIGVSTEIPRFETGMGLDAALACFGRTLAVLQSPDAVTRVASEIAEDAALEGVTTLELRFAPQLHGDDLEQTVDAALAGLAGRGGLILCGLYGEPPALLERLVAIARPRPGVVGLDLAGGPASTHQWRLADYAPAFTAARAAGLGRTVHAGEGRSAAEIVVAVRNLHAQRIGHGTTLLENPEALDLVRAQRVTIEACATSNVHVGALATVADHPLRHWLELGVAAAICTDNTLLSQVDAPTEHARVAAAGVTGPWLERAIACGHAGAFRRG
jgi:adenosine deaminase